MGDKNIIKCWEKLPYSNNIWFISAIVFFLITSFFIYKPHAQNKIKEPSLSSHINHTSATIGGIVEITLQYTLPEGAKPLSPPEIKGFEELTVLKILEEKDRIIVRLLVDRLGSWKTGEISMSYKDNNGELGIVKADPVSLTVLSNLGEKPEEAQLKPIQDIIPASPLWIKYVIWALILIVIAGIIVFTLRWFRRSREGGLYKKTDDPPHILARKELEKLEGLNLFESGKVKQYYFRFSEIIREYLENLRQFPAAEYTTEEIALTIKEETDRKLIPILREADLAKFSDFIPSLAKKEAQVKEIFSYVSETGVIFESREKGTGSGGVIP